MNGAQIARLAKEQLTELTGLRPDTVSSLRYAEGKWHVAVDMIEMKRIPDSSDVLAIYELVLDEAGNLLSYQRTRRYQRGQVEKERGPNSS
jgi:hypothetical protein